MKFSNNDYNDNDKLKTGLHHIIHKNTLCINAPFDNQSQSIAAGHHSTFIGKLPGCFKSPDSLIDYET